jgi:hypothetical protein
MGRLTRGVVSGARVESFDALTQRVRRMAGGLDALGRASPATASPS